MAQDTEQIRPAADQAVDVNSGQVEEIKEQEQIPDTTKNELQKEFETKILETWEVIEENQANTQVEQQEAKNEGSGSQQEQEAEGGENQEELMK